MDTIEPGLEGTATRHVGQEHSAVALASGDVLVFATPMLVALVEEAAVAAVQPHLPAGQTTVGTWLEISHVAATPVGMTVRATAVLEAAEGRTLTFAVAAWDEREKIGEGRHRRAIVVRDRFMARVNAKR
jgi:fluoroacetyl-CoA thioesterase